MYLYTVHCIAMGPYDALTSGTCPVGGQVCQLQCCKCKCETVMCHKPHPLPILFVLQPLEQLVINGKFVDSKTDKWINNYNPATNELISRVPCATAEEMDAALQGAQDAFPGWKDRSILSRQQIMFQFRDLIRKHWVCVLCRVWIM